MIPFITNDSDWYLRPYIFFILRKKYSKPYTGCLKNGAQSLEGLNYLKS
jgi:hypothetical protein